MNNVIGAARALSIEALNSFRLPDWDNTYNEHASFDLAVKSLVLQIRIRTGRVARVYSVELDKPTKARIHHVCQEIREIIERSDLDDRKKNSLLSKLSAFEADVDRIRTRFDNAMLAFVDLADTANKGSEFLKPISDLVTRIKELIGAAKNQEPEPQQLPPPEARKQIEPPRRELPGPEDSGSDDEIPF